MKTHGGKKRGGRQTKSPLRKNVFLDRYTESE